MQQPSNNGVSNNNTPNRNIQHVYNVLQQHHHQQQRQLVAAAASGVSCGAGGVVQGVGGGALASYDGSYSHGGASSGSGSMKIRPFPHIIEMTQIESYWETLRRAILEIQHRNNSGLSFEELYRSAYTMVIHKHGARLYVGLQALVEDHLRENVRVQVLDAINGRFLETLNRCWTDHTTAMVMIRDILMYADRAYVQKESHLEPVYDLGLHSFRDELISYGTINEHLKATLLSVIALERQNEVVEWMDLRSICQMLLALGLGDRRYYEDQFERLFLRESSEFYRLASQRFLAENNAILYIHRVNECLADERERAERYLDPVTGARIVEVLNEELISKNMQIILEMENSGLVFMLSNDRMDDLRCMYELFKRVPNGCRSMIGTMSLFLRERGRSLVTEFGVGPTGPGAATIGAANNTNNPVIFIQNLIDLKDQFDRYLSDAFSNDRDFEHRIQADFEYFINLNTKSAEFLSLYIDEKLRKGMKSLNDGEVEALLEKALVLFKFLQDKDLFEGFYKQHLAKRLLLGKSASDDAEKSMISRLKTECGCQFTTKLEGMFRDIDLSNATMSEFRERENNSLSSNNCTGTSSIDLSVQVLNQLYWPMSQAPPVCVLPASVEQAFRQFELFYLAKHTGRKIVLSPALGTADVKAIFYTTMHGAGPSRAGAGSSSQTARRVYNSSGLAFSGDCNGPLGDGTTSVGTTVPPEVLFVSTEGGGVSALTGGASANKKVKKESVSIGGDYADGGQGSSATGQQKQHGLGQEIIVLDDELSSQQEELGSSASTGQQHNQPSAAFGIAAVNPFGVITGRCQHKQPGISTNGSAIGGVLTSSVAPAPSSHFPLPQQPHSQFRPPVVKEEHKILSVSTYQMCILLRFNQHPRLTFEQLLNETQIPERDLRRALQSLAMGKPSQRVLTCQSRPVASSAVGPGVAQVPNNEIEFGDEFSVNDGFSSKLTRIKILPISASAAAAGASYATSSSSSGGARPQSPRAGLRANPQPAGRRAEEGSSEDTRARIQDDRKHEIEAAIVRVMKARKRSSHNDLVTEVTNMLKSRFLPDPVLIKKRIESLIERDYLERDKCNLRQYNYLA